MRINTRALVVLVALVSLLMIIDLRAQSGGKSVFQVLTLAPSARTAACLLYTSDAADERSSVDLGGRRIIKKKTTAAEELYRRHHKK